MTMFFSALVALVFCLSPGSAAATPAPYAMAFTQKVMAFSPNGAPYPTQVIAPAHIKGMHNYRFDIGGGRSFLVKTNIANPIERGLPEMAQEVARCYHFVEKATGRHLTRGFLLYLIERDTLPHSYSFEASYPTPNRWGQVRLALIKTGAPLTGPGTPANLNELLLDTLPHELGHDALATIPSLLKDVDGQPSQHTRWFTEGVCELLAKGFSSQENPKEYRHFLDLRQVGTVLNDPRIRSTIYRWGQDNSYPMGIESNLYGAALLLVMSWTERVDLPSLLEALDRPHIFFGGPQLLALMKTMTGRNGKQAIARAERIGETLEAEGVLASRRSFRQRLASRPETVPYAEGGEKYGLRPNTPGGPPLHLNRSSS